MYCYNSLINQETLTLGNDHQKWSTLSTSHMCTPGSGALILHSLPMTMCMILKSMDVKPKKSYLFRKGIISFCHCSHFCNKCIYDAFVVRETFSIWAAFTSAQFRNAKCAISSATISLLESDRVPLSICLTDAVQVGSNFLPLKKKSVEQCFLHKMRHNSLTDRTSWQFRQEISVFHDGPFDQITPRIFRRIISNNYIWIIPGTYISNWTGLVHHAEKKHGQVRSLIIFKKSCNTVVFIYTELLS